jgi:hypothetical protein
MSGGGRFAQGESRHPEWDLMYRQGLTAGRIAAICGARRQTVARHIQERVNIDPAIEHERVSNPPAGPFPPSPVWFSRLEAVRLFKEQHGTFPSSRSQDEAERKLAHWLSEQRRRARAGDLTAAKRAALAAIPGWETPLRQIVDERRWQGLLAELVAYKNEHGRWPSYRGALSEQERVLGVWLHARRQEASQRTLAEERRARLDTAVPGWNTWRTYPHLQPDVATGTDEQAT